MSINEAKKSKITTDTNVCAGMKLGSLLANDDIAGDYEFTAVLFYTTIFWVAITTVTTTSNTFFMCHMSLTFLTPEYR